MKWTGEQNQVIRQRGCNLIVSAAAGSGKTAVLVERICTLVLEEGADLERMLIATFTRAAAAEMRERIVQRLIKAIDDNPADARRINDQLVKIDRAMIGTLHSFCGEILRQHYNTAGIEPTFKTEDDSITQGIFDEALEATLDDCFEVGNDDFIALADCWGGRAGGGLADLVRKIYYSARNQPNPMQWLAAKVECFDFADATVTPWVAVLYDKLLQNLALAAEALEEAIRIASHPQGPQSYLVRLAEELCAVRSLAVLCEQGDLEELSQALANPGLFGRLPAWKDPNDTGLGELAKEQREESKKLVKKARENPVVCDMECAVERTRAMLPQMRALCQLVEAFDQRYTAEKRYANVLDFSDLEHLALAVLDDEAVREEVRESFDFVFVDEYQDISPIQDELLRRVSRPGAFFCVGDVKQSIYRFRSAEPEIFISRLLGASRKPGAAEQRIDLNRNFRSANRVVELANYLFSNLMSRQLGGVDYAGGEALVLGAPQPDVVMRDCANELVLIDNEGKGEEELTRLQELVQIEREATVAASRIQSLLGTDIWDGKANTFRKVRPNDIVVLLRTVSGVAAEYAEVFRRAGLPVYAEAEGGFAGELEVELLINLLRLIDNSQRDYELITSMHSPFGQFSLEDLLEVRGLFREGSFAGAVAQYRAQYDTDLSERVGAFLDQLSRWRAVSMHTDVEKLVYRVCDDAGFLDYAGTLPQGERRQANIKQLAEMGRVYSGRLYDFIHDFAALAATVRPRPTGQAAGAVTIMSVHKSKGLEFPVVILANVGKPMNMLDMTDSMLIHGELGLGPRYFNAAKRTRADTLARAALAERIRQDTLSEEMRMLYVAVTRARERLIMVGTVPNLAKRLQKWVLPVSPAGLSSRMRSWVDWLGAMAVRTPSGVDAFAPYGLDAAPLPDSPRSWQITVLPGAEIKALRPVQADRAAAMDRLLAAAEETAVSQELAEAFAWRYPWGDVSALPGKVSATSLLDRDRNWRGPIPAPEIRRVPRFLEQRKAFSATDLGTFVHTALQLLDINLENAAIPQAVAALERRGLLPEGAAEAINMDWIIRFYQSDIARRMRHSSDVRQELPFNLAVPAHVVFPGETGEEEILVQGIIDCCFVEDGKWVLLDYKTNRVDSRNTTQAIATHYRPQILTYRTALEEITGIEVAEAYLYLLSVGEEVRVLL